MADVLLVYVPEDRAYAEGIGGSLERSGLTVADGDGATHAGAEAPCVLVLWSAHSTRSAIVRDVAIRAQREGKLITAKLAGTEAPLGFARPAPHDLSLWAGDPDDPALDPLFFAADRLVCSARINARRDAPRPEPRPAQQPIYPQGGHMHNPGTVRPLRAGPIASIGPGAARAARVEPESAPAVRANDPALPPNVAQEAIAWKRIEQSTDPKDFLDYLTQFSPHGMFCELAQLKLDKLTPKGVKPAFIPHNPSPHSAKPRGTDATRERRAAAQARMDHQAPIDPPHAAPPYDQRPPEPRYDQRPPEPRYEPRPEPRPQPRPEPRPEPRYESRPEPRVEQRYEARPRPRPETREEELEHAAPPQRTATNRPRRRPAPAQEAQRAEPREGGGLPWRPVLIVTLLAAGGFAFFQVLPKQSPSTEAGLSSPYLTEASRAGPLDGLAAPGEVAVPGDAGSSVSAIGGPAASPPPRPAPRQPPAAAPAPAPRALASASQATPAPVISFRPPESTAAAPQPGTTPAIAAQPAPPQPAAPASVQPAPAQPAPAPAPAPAASANANSDFVTPNWTRRPSAQQLSDAYPRRASENNVAGRATMECVIQNGGTLACIPIASTPAGYGFAEAGTTVSRFFRANPANAEGYSIIGKRVRLIISFSPAR